MVLDDADSLRIFDNFRSLYNDKLWPNLTMKMKLITLIKVLSFWKLVGFKWKVSLREKVKDWELFFELKWSKVVWEDQISPERVKPIQQDQNWSNRIKAEPREPNLLQEDQAFLKRTEIDRKRQNLSWDNQMFTQED